MQTSIKFPIGSRVRHSYVGAATVTGHPFTGATGDVNLPVEFDHPHYDGSSGWHEVFFTLIDPPQNAPITFGEWARNRRTVNLMKRCENAQQATSAYYEAHKAELHKNIKLRHRVEELEKQEVEMRLTAARALTELEAAREEIKRRVANIDKLQGTLDGIRKIMA